MVNVGVKISNDALKQQFLEGRCDILYRYYINGEWTKWRSQYTNLTTERRCAVNYPWDVKVGGLVGRIEWKREGSLLPKLTMKQKEKLAREGYWHL